METPWLPRKQRSTFKLLSKKWPFFTYEHVIVTNEFKFEEIVRNGMLIPL